MPGGHVLEAFLPEPNQLEKMSPWALDLRQIEPGAMQTHIRVRSGQIMSLLEISMNRGVHQQGTAPPGTLTFGVPFSKGSLRWHGTDVQMGQCITFGDERGFEGLSNSGFHGVTFSALNSEVEALADRLGIPMDESVRASGVIDPAERTMKISEMSKKARGFLQSAHANVLDLGAEEELLTIFLCAAASNEKHENQSSGRQRARAVRIALEFMRDNVEENVPISFISETAGVSLRTLNRAFREAFGIGPKAYYLQLRLGLLRRALIESDKSKLVSDLAYPLGFWHMGQLARDYRSQFGELPSETRSYE